ncbi:MAG: OsmC family protein [Leptolinea sp.]
MLSQVAQFAPYFNVILVDVNVDLRAEFDSAAKYGLPGPGTAFQKVIYKVNVVSPSPEDQVNALLQHAEQSCHTAQSFIQPVPVEVQATIKQPAVP